MDNSDIIRLLLAAYQDHAQKQALAQVRQGCLDLLAADAASRRTVAAADIKVMAKLRISLTKFQMSYDKLKEEFGPVDAVEDYISEIQSKIKTLSDKKNKTHR